MPFYSSVHVQHFRSYADFEVPLVQGVNIVVGPNGSGKTNLLETLFVLSTGGSFRAQDRDLLQYGQEWFRLDAYYGEETRALTYRVLGDVVEKQFVLDGTKKARLTHSQRVPVVLFEPDHLRLLRDSPSKRRDYLDVLLIKLHPEFAWLKHQFERVLTQRNAMLKRRLPSRQLEDQIFAWDLKFAELAEQVVTRRQELIKQLHGVAGEVYSAIADKQHDVTVEYQSSVASGNYHAGLLKLLSERLARDVERGFTGVGPQRDDFTITLNGAPAAVSASRGEMRSLLLTLKIIELQLLGAEHATTPLLLLDDVFSELDAARRRALAAFSSSHQTLITTTDADMILGHFKDYKIIKTTPTS